MFSLRLVMLLQLMNSERKRWFLLVHLNCLLMAGSLGQGNSQVHPQSLGVVTAARFVLWAVTWDSYTPPVKNLRYEREQTPALLRLAYATLWTALIMVQSAKITLEYRITRLRALGSKWKYLEPLTWKKKIEFRISIMHITVYKNKVNMKWKI